MKPLRDTPQHDDPQHERAVRLLRAVGPLVRSPQRRARVWRTLNADQCGAAPGPRLLRPLLLASMVCAATASATVGSDWLWPGGAPEPAEAQPPAPPPRPGTATPRRAAPQAQSPAPGETEQPGDVAEQPSATPPPAERGAAVPDNEVPRPPRTDAAQGRPSAPGAAPSAGDAKAAAAASLMLEAMQARRAGDVAKAERLAAEYRRSHPQGALEEEALVLSFEAAAARKDSKAAELARVYLNRYPHGRFTQQAQRVVQTTAP